MKYLKKQHSQYTNIHKNRHIDIERVRIFYIFKIFKIGGPFFNIIGSVYSIHGIRLNLLKLKYKGNWSNHATCI